MTGNAKKRLSAHRVSQIVLYALVIMLSFPMSQAHGEIYRWKDKDGNVHFGDRPPPEATTKKVEIKVNTYESVEVHNNPDMFYKRDKEKQGANRVVMYSAEWCGVCKRAKSYFKKKKIPFQELDIDKSEKARKGFEKLEGRGVPIILVGNKRMNGFSPKRFEEMYADAR